MASVKKMAGWYKHAAIQGGSESYFKASGEVQKNGSIPGTIVRKDLGSRAAPKAKNASVSNMDRNFWIEVDTSQVPADVKAKG